MTKSGWSKGRYSELLSVNSCFAFEDSSSHVACARDAVLILLLFRRQLSCRIECVDTMVARREHAYRA